MSHIGTDVSNDQVQAILLILKHKFNFSYENYFGREIAYSFILLKKEGIMKNAKNILLEAGIWLSIAIPMLIVVID